MVAPTVIAEVRYLLHERAGAAAEALFLRAFTTGELHLADLLPSDLRRIVDLAERYVDLGPGDTNASIVAIADRLGVTDIVTDIGTLDRRYFCVVLPRHIEAFISCPLTGRQ